MGKIRRRRISLGYSGHELEAWRIVELVSSYKGSPVNVSTCYLDLTSTFLPWIRKCARPYLSLMNSSSLNYHLHVEFKARFLTDSNNLTKAQVHFSITRSQTLLGTACLPSRAMIRGWKVKLTTNYYDCPRLALPKASLCTASKCAVPIPFSSHS